MIRGVNMDKKYFWIIIIVILIIIGGIFILNSSQISQDKTFVVGFYNETAPYAFVDSNGNATGFDLEVAQEVAKRNNWTFKVVPINWDLKQNYLNNGSVDCIWSGFTVNNRGGDYTFSNSYLDSKQVIIVLKSSGINNTNDLNGKVVETLSNSSLVDALNNQNISFAKIVQDDSIANTFKDLDAGSCDAVAMDIGIAKYYINGSDKYVILDQPIGHEKYAVGFKLGNNALKNKVDQTLDEMFKDGTLQKIAKKYNIEESLINR